MIVTSKGQIGSKQHAQVAPLTSLGLLIGFMGGYQRKIFKLWISLRPNFGESKGRFGVVDNESFETDEKKVKNELEGNILNLDRLALRPKSYWAGFKEERVVSIFQRKVGCGPRKVLKPKRPKINQLKQIKEAHLHDLIPLAFVKGKAGKSCNPYLLGLFPKVIWLWKEWFGGAPWGNVRKVCSFGYGEA